MDEFLEQFVLEGRELVQQAFDDLLVLERTGHDPARIDGAFRAIHTLKGSVGLFDFAPLAAILHAAEDLMVTWRASGQVVGIQAIEALLECMTATEAWIEAVARTQLLPDDAAERSRRLVEALQAVPGAAPEGQPKAAASGEDAPPDWLLALMAHVPPGADRMAIRYQPEADCFFLGDDPLALMTRMPSLLALRIAPRTAWSLADYDPFHCNMAITAMSTAPEAALKEVFRLVSDQVTILPCPAANGLADPDAHPDAHPDEDPDAYQAMAQQAPNGAPDASMRTLRIEAARVDALANLVSELFIAKNRLAHLAAEAAAAAPGLARALAANHTAIEGLVGTLHRSVMALRLVPLEQSLRRLPRLVREIAARLGRDVRFVIEGAHLQADKATVDGLFEPLLHVLRNAIDHGIKPAAVREAAGKPAQGRITLRAALVGDQVVISVEDDGAGIDPAVLRRAALARDLHTQAALDGMDDAAVLDLIFVAGFSTAAAVTDVSGRGVGMDVVRNALHGLGGEAGIASAPGRGTTIRLSVPQAASVSTIVIVMLGGERFGLPIDAIVETARVKRAAILPVASGAAFVLRERTIPLLRLADLLGRAVPCSGSDATIVVVASAGGQIGIEVDGFGARMEVVLRPLRGLLAGLHGVRGSAILGDGHVLLVLEPGVLTA